MKLKQLLALSLLVFTANAASAADKPVVRPTEYEMLRMIPKARLLALLDDRPDAKGLVGSNRQGGYWIEAGTQRGSCRSVIANVVADNLGGADDSWRGVEETFKHQRADGGFEAGDRPNGKSAKPFGAAVETAFFFLQECGRMVIVLRQSPHEAHFHDRLVALEPKMRRAAAFISTGYDQIIKDSSHAVNRIVIAAKAFGLCGVALHDEKLVEISKKLIAHAITLRDKDGVFIENGGRDSSYNVVSILFGQVLALHVPIPEFEAVLPAAMAWQLTRIKDTGEVDVTGNTRTGVGKEQSYFGEPKIVNYPEVVQALTFYGLLHHDQKILDTADRVFAYFEAHPKEKAKTKK